MQEKIEKLIVQHRLSSRALVDLQSYKAAVVFFKPRPFKFLWLSGSLAFRRFSTKPVLGKPEKLKNSLSLSIPKVICKVAKTNKNFCYKPLGITGMGFISNNHFFVKSSQVKYNVYYVEQTNTT